MCCSAPGKRLHVSRFNINGVEERGMGSLKVLETQVGLPYEKECMKTGAWSEGVAEERGHGGDSR